MLTAAASNALLKTLEEAPAHVVFVLATTDPQKVLPTIRSRCQHFELHLLSADRAGGARRVHHRGRRPRRSRRNRRLRRTGRQWIGARHGVRPRSDRRCRWAAREHRSPRRPGRIVVRARHRQGTSRRRPRDRRRAGPPCARRSADRAVARRVPLVGGRRCSNGCPTASATRVRAQAERLGPAGATRALEVLGEAFVGIQDAPDPRITLEVALVRLTRPDAELSLSALADRVGRLERGQGVAPAPASPTTSAPLPAPSSTQPGDEPRPPARDLTPDPEAGEGAIGSAAEARERLAQSRPPAGARAASKAGAATKTAPKRGAAPRKPAAPEVNAAPKANAAPPSAPVDGGLPTRDEIVLAWGDVVLPSLPARAKSRFSPGRFLDVESDAVVFGLPNKIHAAKCEEVRPEVEAALAAHFGRPTPLRIVVDTAAPAPSAARRSAAVGLFGVRTRVGRRGGRPHRVDRRHRRAGHGRRCGAPDLPGRRGDRR